MNLNNLPDEDLIIYIKNHDLASYKNIVERYQEKVFRYTTATTGNELVGLELAEETFIEVYRNLNDIAQGVKFEVILFQVAHNLVTSYLKKLGRRNITEGESLLDEFFRIDNTDSEFLNQKFIDNLPKVIHKLDFVYREVLVLHFVLSFSTSDISDILKIPVNAVYIHLDEARAKALNLL